MKLKACKHCKEVPDLSVVNREGKPYAYRVRCGCPRMMVQIGMAGEDLNELATLWNAQA